MQRDLCFPDASSRSIGGRALIALTSGIRTEADEILNPAVV